MANNYLQFSQQLTLSSDEKKEREWCKDRLEALEELFEAWDGTDEDRLNFSEDQQEWLAFESLGFEWGLDDDGVWVYAEEFGNPDAVAAFIQEFLIEFQRPDSWSMTWANTCSKPRIGEFSGGAAFVTATDVKFMLADNWLMEQETNHKKDTDNSYEKMVEILRADPEQFFQNQDSEG